MLHALHPSIYLDVSGIDYSLIEEQSTIYLVSSVSEAIFPQSPKHMLKRKVKLLKESIHITWHMWWLILIVTLTKLRGAWGIRTLYFSVCLWESFWRWLTYGRVTERETPTANMDNAIQWSTDHDRIKWKRKATNMWRLKNALMPASFLKASSLSAQTHRTAAQELQASSLTPGWLHGLKAASCLD